MHLHGLEGEVHIGGTKATDMLLLIPLSVLSLHESLLAGGSTMLLDG